MDQLRLKADTAENILESLTQEQRIKIAPYVEEIKAAQRELDILLVEFEVAQRCAKCDIPCCTVGIEGLFTEEYLFFLLFKLSDETRYDIRHVLQNNNETENCRFLGKKGCIIPLDSRPYICKRSFCSRFGPVQKLADIYSEKLEDVFSTFYRKLMHL